MLSEKAFNGLLKTLEEPPPQTIFIFATTEVRKVPVTVLSRCQRFDLRRVEGERAAPSSGRDRRRASGCGSSPARSRCWCAPPRARCATASRCSTRRSRCSARDGDARSPRAQVQDMLGLADRGRVLDAVRAGGARRDQGRARPARPSSTTSAPSREAVLQDLLEISHWLTRIKVAPEAAPGVRGRRRPTPRAAQALAARLSSCRCWRANWQMLLKGLEDVRQAPSPLLAAEMVLVRLAYVAELPPPAELARRCSSRGEAAGRHAGRSGAPAGAGRGRPALAAPVERRDRRAGADASRPGRRGAPIAGREPASFAEAVELFRRLRRADAAWLAVQAARLVHFEPGRIELRARRRHARRADRPDRGGARPLDRPALAGQRRRRGRAAAPTLAEQAAAAQAGADRCARRRPAGQAGPRELSRAPGSSTCARPRTEPHPPIDRSDHEEPRQHAQGSPEAAEPDGRDAGQAGRRSRSPARPAAAWSR